MPPKRTRTMLLVACALPTTMMAACGQEVGQCHGFCLDDASFDAMTEQPSGCIGFYPTDATFDVTTADANADGDANAHADDAAHE